MKKTAILPFLLLALTILSCSTEREASEKETTEDLLEVGFRLQDEFTITESQLKSAQTRNDMFALQFYDLEKQRPYAHVVGDDISKIQVAFKKDRKYKLKMAYIKNGKNIIAEFAENSWGKPFYIYGSETPLNKVTYSSGTELELLSTAELNAKDEKLDSGRYVEVDRYHAVMDSIVFTEDTEVLPIDLKRMVFGLELNVELEDRSVEQLRFAFIFRNERKQEYLITMKEGQGRLEIPYVTLGFPEYFFTGDIHLDHGVSDDYMEDVHISIGTSENSLYYFNGTIPVNRNVKLLLQLTAGQGDHSENNFDLLLESTEMEEEDTVLNVDEER